jgi:DNA-binding response OmpR family regulator
VKILVGDADRTLVLRLQSVLHQAGHVVHGTHDGNEAGLALTTWAFDLAILDIDLPGLAAVSIIQHAQNRIDKLAIIMIGREVTPTYAACVLDLGADDILGKPMDLAELKARIGAVGRRMLGSRSALVRIGQLEFDTRTGTLYCAGCAMPLPRRELVLLNLLTRRVGAVVPAEELTSGLADYDQIGSSLNALQLTASRLRKRISMYGVRIENCRGLGYRIYGLSA